MGFCDCLAGSHKPFPEPTWELEVDPVDKKAIKVRNV